MICIQCGTVVESLYIVYSKGHIQLTDCPQCKNVVDKYVEIDNVLLFIDLLLLKPGAYRHLVFNTLKSRSGWFSLDDVRRLWVFLLTLEVYLAWYTEERKYGIYLHDVSDLHGLVVPYRSVLSHIFTWSAFNQYLYFAGYCMLDMLILNYGTRYLIINVYKWGKDLPNAGNIISFTILLSYGAKIFPILMLIWPYDTLVSIRIINWVANFYIIEALKIVTDLSYKNICSIFISILMLRYIVVYSILLISISRFNIFSIKEYFKNEIVMFVNGQW